MVENFEKMPSRIQTSLIHKESEIERRSREIFLARDGAEFRVCEVNDPLQKPYVINFEFFVSLKNKIDFANIPIYYNKLDNKLPDARSFIPNRVHDVIVPQFDGTVHVRVTKIPGTNTVPWNFNSGNVFQSSVPLKR